MKRDDELLALTEEALGRLAAPTGSPKGVSDPQAAIWTRDLRARALRALGRPDEAEAAWRQAIAQANTGAGASASRASTRAILPAGCSRKKRPTWSRLLPIPAGATSFEASSNRAFSIVPAAST